MFTHYCVLAVCYAFCYTADIIEQSMFEFVNQNSVTKCDRRHLGVPQYIWGETTTLLNYNTLDQNNT